MTSNLIEAIVSVQRLSSFLTADELQPDARKLIEKPNLHLGDEVGGLIEKKNIFNDENSYRCSQSRTLISRGPKQTPSRLLREST